MSDVGDFLELANGAPESFRTLRATLRAWRDEELCQEAIARGIEQMEAAGHRTVTMYAMSEGDDPAPNETEEIVSIWLERPGGYREEVDGREPRTHVSDGERAWMWTSYTGPVEHEVDAGGTEFEALTRPLGSLASLELETIASGTVAGRPAAIARGRPRPSAASGFMHFRGLLNVPDGADEYELALDAERGMLLRASGTLDGRPVAVVEVVEIAFDEELPPETFVLTPGPGEVVRRAEDVYSTSDFDLTLEDAVLRADFPVWIPASLARGWELTVMYAPAGEMLGDQVVLHYHTWDDEASQLSIQERRAGDPLAGGGFEEVERDGRSFFVWEQESRLPLPVRVRLEREGTFVELSSADLGRERLLEVAASLVRAGAEPPRLLADE